MKILELSCALLLVLLALLASQASCKDPCSKDWLRFMVVNACGMDKRHLERRRPISAASSLLEILSEVDEELEHWKFQHEGLGDSEEFQQTLVAASDTTDNQDKQTPAKPEGDKAYTRLSDHPGQVLTAEWLGLAGREPKRAPRRRAIQNMISRCCAEDCSEDAFEGVCD